MEVLPNWRRDLWADWTLQMLDARAEVFSRAEYWSGRDWASYRIFDASCNLIARGSAGDVEAAKGIAWELVVGFWNARAGMFARQVKP